jgi:hypothetical protein
MAEHPITPPPELVKKWLADFYGPETIPGMVPGEMALHLVAVAARWGSDQELEACCEWLFSVGLVGKKLQELRVARRPKPPSLKEQSIALLDKIQSNKQMWQVDELNVVRRALEQLND